MAAAEGGGGEGAGDFGGKEGILGFEAGMRGIMLEVG